MTCYCSSSCCSIKVESPTVWRAMKKEELLVITKRLVGSRNSLVCYKCAPWILVACWISSNEGEIVEFCGFVTSLRAINC